MEYISKLFIQKGRILFWERIIYINHTKHQVLLNNIISINALNVTEKLQNILVLHAPNIFLNYATRKLENLNRDTVKTIKH